MRVALDSNILVYAEGANGQARQDMARTLLAGLPRGAAVLPAQALGELFNVLVRKAGRSPDDARQAVFEWRDSYPVCGTSSEVLLSAIDLAVDHRLSIWDSVMLSAAAESDCRLLLSEDLQNGFSWRGVTVVNPFATERHPLLEALLA